MEEEDFQEDLEAMEEDMDDAQQRRRRTKKKRVVDPEPFHDYPGGPHDTSLLWRYLVHVARKTVDGGYLLMLNLL